MKPADRTDWLLVLLALAVWASVPFGSFQYDDFPNVVLEPSTRDLAEASGLRPLLRLSYFLDHALWGMRASGFLLTNLLVHVASVLAVFRLARAVARGEDGARAALAAPFAAALFAVQPAHAETVAYVTGRSTGLMSALLLWGLVLHARGREAAALALFALACAAKEVALIFPALALLVRPDARALRRQALLALAILAALAVVPRNRELAAWSLGAYGPGDALLRGLGALPALVSLWVRPWALSVEHPFEPAAPALLALACAAALAALIAAAFAARRREPLFAFAVAWVLVALAPTNSIVARADPIAEKALYLAWVGPAVLLGDALGRLAARAPRQGVAAAALTLSLCTGFAASRVRVWSDERLLWADAAEKAPHSARVWNNLGMAHFGDADYEAARDAFQRALALDPRNAQAAANLHQVAIACGRRCASE